jgi:hypothetical protein
MSYDLPVDGVAGFDSFVEEALSFPAGEAFGSEDFAESDVELSDPLSLALSDALSFPLSPLSFPLSDDELDPDADSPLSLRE